MFNVGDVVEINTNFGPYVSANGKQGIITCSGILGYTVKLYIPLSLGNRLIHNLFLEEKELKLIHSSSIPTPLYNVNLTQNIPWPDKEPITKTIKTCQHTFIPYTGIKEQFEFCTKCDAKKDKVS